MAIVFTPPPRGLEHPDEDATKHENRWRFLQAVHRVQPRVSGDLMGEPLDLFRPILEQAIARLPAEHRDTWRYRDVEPTWGWFKHADAWQEQHHPGSLRLREYLLHWAHTWRLEDEWILETAVETLVHYSIDRDQPTLMPLHYSGHMMGIADPFSDEEIGFTFDPDDGWTASIESWAAAKDRLTASFNGALREYRQRVEAMYREEGFEPLSGTRSRGGDHYEWLARHVVEREKFTEIARSTSTGVERQAVSPAVKDKAALIGPTLPSERQKSAS